MDLTRQDNGASAVEYGMIVFAIAALITVIVFLLGEVSFDLFQGSCDAINNEVNGGSC